MSNQADIRDIQVLGDLKTAFGTFSEELQQILPAIQKQFEEIQEQLDDRQKHWKQEADTAQEEVYEARQSLRDCENQSNDEDGNPPDCSCEQDKVADAERALTENEENLETVKQWRHRVEGLICDFEKNMNQLSILASSRTEAAKVFLADKMEVLDRYVGANPNLVSSYPVNFHARAPIEPKPISPQLQIDGNGDKIETRWHQAKFGSSATINYKLTFFTAYPFVKGEVVVHHAVEQIVLERYPGIVTESEIHSLENLRGVPNEFNGPLHLSLIRSIWNEFYRQNQTVTKEQLLAMASDIDTKYGHNFWPTTVDFTT